MDIGDPVTITITEIDPPGPPQNVVATPLTGRVTLDWDPPAVDGGSPITDYEYRRKRGTADFQDDWALVEDKLFNHTLGDDGTSLVFRARYIGTDETFTYEVRAVNAGGPGAALASNAIDLPPATRYRWELPEVRVPEGVGTATVNAVMEIPDGWGPYDEDLRVTASSMTGTATSGEDYAPVTEQVFFRPEDFKEVSGRWIATLGVAVAIMDDRLLEDEESFTVKIEKGPGLVTWVQPDTDSTKLTTTVVIEDDEEPLSCPQLDNV